MPRPRISSNYSQKNNENEAVAAANMVSCLANETSEAIKNELEVSCGGVRISRLPAYGQDHVDGQQVMTIDSHNWGENEALQQGELSDNVYSAADAVMKQYSTPNVSGSIPISGRLMTDRERLQLHNQLSWDEAAKQDVIIVRCRDMTAELHKIRLGSGSKGKCIKMGEQWMTPSEFESLAGRGSSKDWKRSIRFGGHTLQKLIEEGILAPHAIACTCSICCGDTTLTGPVRLFTPYKRKRKDGNDSESNQGHVMSGGAHAYGQIEEIIGAMYTASQQLKIMLEQLRLQYEAMRDSAINQIRVQSELEKQEALVQQRTDIVNILRRVLNVDQDVLLQQIMSQLQVENPHAKSCSNCGRDAFLECTACRRACYCSTYCQQRDWPVHQHQCALVQNSESMVASNTIQSQVDESHDNQSTTREENAAEN